MVLERLELRTLLSTNNLHVQTDSPATAQKLGSVALSSAELRTVSDVASASQITYTMTQLPQNGNLFLNNSRLLVGSQFTQSDINSGSVTYINTSGRLGNDSFNFQVSDGTFVNTTSVLDVDATGFPANSSSTDATANADGRIVAFESTASDIVPNDTNATRDSFIYDRNQGVSQRVDLSVLGLQPQFGSGGGAPRGTVISSDGRFVAFTSASQDLVPGASTTSNNVYLRNTAAGQLGLVSVGLNNAAANGASGLQGMAISSTGRYVAFASDATNLVKSDTNKQTDVFLRDMVLGTTQIVSALPPATTLATIGIQGDAASNDPGMSPDGNFVAFASAARTLSTAANGNRQIYLKNMSTGQLQIVSTDVGGNAGNGNSDHPVVTADGRFVIFASGSSNLVGNDANGQQDIFVKDMYSGVVTMVSRNFDGTQAGAASDNPVVTPDGRFIAFESNANLARSSSQQNVGGIYVFDSISNTLREASVTSSASPTSASARGDVQPHLPSISNDGQTVVYSSGATNLSSLLPAGNQFTHIYANSAQGNALNGTFNLTVVASIPPVIDPIADQQVPEDGISAPIVFNVKTFDGTDGSAVGLVATSDNPAMLPSSSFVFGKSGTSHTLTITPVPLHEGTAVVTITAFDTLNTASKGVPFNVTVSHVNHAPQITPQTQAQLLAFPNIPYVLQIMATDIDGPLLTYGVVMNDQFPAGAAFDPASHTFSWTPASNQITTVAPYMPTFTVSDGITTTSAQFSITVTNPRPDVTGATFALSSKPYLVGSSFLANFAIKNQGPLAAPPFDVGFYMSRNGSSLVIGTTHVAGIAANSTTTTLSQILTLPGLGDPFYSGDGIYTIGMTLDSGFAMDELSKSNNSSVGQGIDFDTTVIRGTQGDANVVGRVFRTYNPFAQTHFFTTSQAEFQAVVSRGYNDESTNQPGFAFLTSPDTNAAPVHRLYNPNNGGHYLTASDGEKGVLEAVGWIVEPDEGFIYTTATPFTLPLGAPPYVREVFHIYNQNTGTHVYTTSTVELGALVAHPSDGWQQQTSLGFALPDTPASFSFVSGASRRSSLSAEHATSLTASVTTPSLAPSLNTGVGGVADVRQATTSTSSGGAAATTDTPAPLTGTGNSAKSLADEPAAVALGLDGVFAEFAHSGVL